MADIKTSYMGLQLRNPVIVASSGLTDALPGIKKCEEAGAGAVVLKSIFEEQFLGEQDLFKEAVNIYPEALDYMRHGGLLEYAPQDVIRVIEQAKREATIPVIASINCRSTKLWPRFARQLQDAGADGLELNIYFLPIDLETPGADFERLHCDIVKAVKAEVTIPVSVKLASQVTSIPYLARKLVDAGCDGLVLFNWFLVPDIDLNSLRTRSLKGKGDFHQSLRWVGILSGRVACDVVSSGGIRNGNDAIKQILAGASAVQICSLFYQDGLEAIQAILDRMEAWMAERKYSDLESFKGELSYQKQELSTKDSGEAEIYFRSQYMKTYAGNK